MKLYRVTLSGEVDARSKPKALRQFVICVVSSFLQGKLKVAVQTVDVKEVE